MSAKRAKFRVGQVVMNLLDGRYRKIDRCHFDPLDGWEYHFKFENPIIYEFEEDLRAQTRREKGDAR